jgi:hypothetical protein
MQIVVSFPDPTVFTSEAASLVLSHGRRRVSER